jgi:D-alanine-D-alanine ligase-like ATP-grasp enzyme
MKLDRKRLTQLRDAIAQVEPTYFGLHEVEIFPGPNPYSERSVVVLHLGGKAEAVAAAAAQEAGRLASARIGVEMSRGVRSGEGNRLACWLEYFPGGSNLQSVAFALQALQTALVTVAPSRPGDRRRRQRVTAELEALQSTGAHLVDVQSQFLVAAARRAGVPVHNVGRTNLVWQFGWGARSEIFFLTASTEDAVPGHQATRMKQITKALFEEIGLPTPAWRLVTQNEDPLAAANEVGWPCVVKPPNQAFGNGVTANVANAAELGRAVAVARAFSPLTMIEAHEPGWDHRLMVVDGRLVAAIRRDPPSITGDGKSNVEELIAALNQGRDGSREKGYLLPVQRDQPLDERLARRGLSMASVLPLGETLVLRSVANFSTGGSTKDMTSVIHPQIKGLAESLATSLGLRTAGIDYITTDISRSHDEVGGGFIEVNAMPRIRLLMAAGLPEEEVGSILLGERPGRIPVTLVIASRADLAEMQGEVRRRTATRPGAAAASAGWAQIGPAELPAGGLDPVATISAVLRHRTVDELVILWSPREIEEFGFPVDRLRRAVLVGEEVGEIWLSVLQRLCPDIISAGDPAAALEAALAR